MYKCVFVCVQTYMYMYMCVCMCTRVYVYVHVCICMCTHVYVYELVHAHVHVHLYSYAPPCHVVLFHVTRMRTLLQNKAYFTRLFCKRDLQKRPLILRSLTIVRRHKHTHTHTLAHTHTYTRTHAHTHTHTHKHTAVMLSYVFMQILCMF